MKDVKDYTVMDWAETFDVPIEQAEKIMYALEHCDNYEDAVFIIDREGSDLL